MKNVIARYWYIVLCVVFFSAAGSLFANTPPALEILSPRDGDAVKMGSEVVVAISIYDEEGDLDTTSMKLEVNGRDVTRQANTSAFLVTYSITDTAKAGRQNISFDVSDRAGNVATHESHFNILAEPEKVRAASMNGTVGVGGEYDREAPQSEIGYLQVDMYGSLSPSFDYALTIDATNRESTDLQRVSEVRFDLYSPWFSLVLGDATPRFSDYTVDGKRVTGIHILPQFGWFGFELIGGRTERAVDAQDASTEVETFEQMLFGGRLKLGRPDSFLWGLSFLKVEDDKNSIDYVDDAASPTPKDNIVVGTDFNFAFSDSRVKVYAEVDASLLNTDTTGGTQTTEDIDIPSFVDSIITVNENLIPLTLGSSNFAAKGALTIGPFVENTFYGEYSFIGPAYFSLANPSIINDRQGFQLRDSIWLLNQALFINASFQRYTNNLENTQNYTTTNAGGSGAVYVYPTPFMSINAGVDVTTVKNDAPAADVEAVKNTNTTINAGIAQDLEILASATNVYFTYSTALFRDENVTANDADTHTFRIGAISYFNNFPLDTKAVVGGDIGDPDDSFYIEGFGGYRFLRERTLYTYLGAIYETGIEQLDLRTGLDYDITPDVKLTAELQYLTSPTDIEDLFISAFATYEF